MELNIIILIKLAKHILTYLITFFKMISLKNYFINFTNFKFFNSITYNI